jgi:hypothetical protein
MSISQIDVLYEKLSKNFPVTIPYSGEPELAAAKMK